jgi:hypothetical protein
VNVSVGEDGLVRRFMGVVHSRRARGAKPDWLVRGWKPWLTLDQQRRRREQLRPPRAWPTDTRVRPRQARWSGDRRASRRSGEKLTTLDGSERSLNEEMIVIADATGRRLSRA